MKKIFASLLVFIMIFTLIPTKTITLGLWDEPWLPNGTDFFENDIGYSIDNGEAQVTFCNSNDKIINIPKEIRGYPVTKIREYAFSRSEASGRVMRPAPTERLQLPNTITHIGKEAFSGCSELLEIIPSNALVSVGEDALLGTKWYENQLNGIIYIGTVVYGYKGACPKNINFKSGIFGIADAAFSESKIQTMKLPNGIIEIGNKAFYNCDKLEEINFPNSLIKIGNSAFKDCDGITSIIIPNNVRYIGESAFYWCGNLNDLQYNAINCEKISSTAFSDIKTLKISNNVKIIPDDAFYSCRDLENVTLGNKVTEIGCRAFYRCEDLIYINVPDNVLKIADEAFYESGIEAITLGRKIMRIGKNVFPTYLKNVFYKGTVTDKNKISILNSNSNLKNAKWYYNSCIGKATHSYKDYVTKATLKKNGSIVRKCSVCGSVYKKTTVYYPKTIKLSATNYTYNGKTKTPTVTVKGSNGKTISKSYYTVKYASGRKNVGKYKVTITFKGNYSGTKTLYFTINPVKTSVTKLTAAKKALTVNISKKSSQVTGYEIQYATNKKFTKAKTTTVKSYKTTKVTLKKLSAKKTYYVRVRTYKTVGKTKYYSGWSTVKYKKTK